MTRLNFLASAGFAIACTLAPLAAFATPYFSPNNLLPPDLLISGPSQQVMYANGMKMSELRLTEPDFKVAIDDASPPAVNIRFNVSVQLLSGLAMNAGLDNDCDGQVDIIPTGGGYFTSAISGLQMSGPNMPVGVMIRESPTLASNGGGSCLPVPGGYMIDSFFDIFTELSVDGGNSWSPVTNYSLDGGQTWHDGQYPMHIETTPEPGSLALLALGGLAVVRRQRR
jgi:hypothetical protein